MLTVAAVLAIFVYGIIAAMLGTILPDISKRFNLTPKQNGNIAMAQAIDEREMNPSTQVQTVIRALQGMST